MVGLNPHAVTLRFQAWYLTGKVNAA